MFRAAAFLIAWLIAAPAWAFLPGQPVGMLNPQVQPANSIAGLPAVDDNLAAGGYPVAGGICAEWGHQVPCNNHYSTVRASTKYVSASDGLYVSVPANVMAMGSSNGSLIEEARTNDALWSRDMTNAVWVKTTMTTALNAVGIDGTSNSATTLTATGASAMAVETITLASQADNYSVFLKRVTGSGTINLCLAATACASPTACTVTSTTAFTRCTVTATVLNPIVGVQIITNGDAVIADFNQMEPGGNATSPILTTVATATRSSDLVALQGAPLATVQSSSGSVFLNASSFVAATNVTRALGVTATGLAHAFTTGASIVGTFNGSVALSATFGSGTWGTGMRASVGWSASGRSIVANNGTVATDAGILTAQSNQLGGGGGNFLDGSFLRLTAYSSRFSDTTLKALTQ